MTYAVSGTSRRGDRSPSRDVVMDHGWAYGRADQIVAASSVAWRMARFASSSAASSAPPMTCTLTPRGGEHRAEGVDGLLAGAHDDGVDLEDLRVGALGAVRDVQAGVVDALVVDADVLVNALGLQRRPVHPARRPAEALADRASPCAAAGAPRAATLRVAGRPGRHARRPGRRRPTPPSTHRR